MKRLLLSAVAAAGSALFVLVMMFKPGKRRQGLDVKHLRSLKALKGLEDINKVLQDGQAASLASGVESVEVHSPSLAYFPPLLSTLTSLTKLDLSGCSVTYIPFSVSSISQLKHLSLSRNKLRTFAEEVGSLTKLQSLDASHNELASLPGKLCQLSCLEVCNAMSNRLTQLPDEIGLLTRLRLLGLKSNKLQALPDSFSQLSNLVELFLTDNCLTRFPPGFERLSSLVKLQASFNSFESIPEQFSQLPRLEMMRVAVCNISCLPSSMSGQQPPHSTASSSAPPPWSSLAWFSLGGNPVCSNMPPVRHGLHEIFEDELQIHDKLGDGASGEVFRAIWRQQHVAVKFFRADVSPDGRTVEEVAIACAVDHPHLTKVEATMKKAASALVMGICSGEPMAAKPTSAHLLRCKWDPLQTFSCGFALKVALGVSSALDFLHSMQICHGDVYAHNILVDQDGHATLCDFGASFYYSKEQRSFWEAMEVRAFGLFLLDLVNQVRLDKKSQPVSGCPDLTEEAALAALQGLHTCCLHAFPAMRPGFAEIALEVQSLVARLPRV